MIVGIKPISILIILLFDIILFIIYITMKKINIEEET